MPPGLFPRPPRPTGGFPPNNNLGRLFSPMNATTNATNAAPRSGGLLSNLFRRGAGSNAANATRAITGFQRAGSAATAGSNLTGSGILSSIANPGRISGFLNNTQTVLKTAQQFGPMVQQYGPIVKNLPAMFKMYRSLSGSNTSSTEAEAKTEDTTENETVKQETTETTSNDTVQQKKKKTETKKKKKVSKPSTKSKEAGKSVPKLYI